MEVEAFNLKIKNVLVKGKFIIPEYQREYDWEEDEIEELLEDIYETESNESYFIGHMVFEGRFNENEFKVIDGQQRITTITIILCVIRDLFYEKGIKKLGDGINDNYIFTKDVNYETYAILENKMPYPILQTYVQSKPEKKDKNKKPQKKGEEKIIKAYNLFYSTFKDKTEDELKELRDKVLNLEVIFVAASDKVDAHSIFMTLNATGKNLSSIDLIKNQIFSQYPKEPHIDEPNDTWTQIIKNISKKGDKFFNNFWASHYKKISDSRLFKEFYKEIIKKETIDIKDFLECLLKDSFIYKKISEPSEDDWKGQNEQKIYLSINAIIDVFNIEVANSMLISLIREYQDKNISLDFLYKSLNAIEKFHFINNAICSNRSSGLDLFYSKHSRELLKSKDKEEKHRVINKFIKDIESKIPEKDKFQSHFDSKLFFSSKSEKLNKSKLTKQKKLISYVLKKIEFKKQRGNIQLYNMSIEHICPENPSKDGWEEIDKELIANIGNLVLLDTGLNSKMGNCNYSKKKKKILSESNIISTKEIFSNNEEWNKKSIIKRRNELIDYTFEDIWK